MLKLFNLLALSSLAVLLSISATPGVSASPSPFHAAKRTHSHLARSLQSRSTLDTGLVRKAKRGTKCRPRPGAPPAPEGGDDNQGGNNDQPPANNDQPPANNDQPPANNDQPPANNDQPPPANNPPPSSGSGGGKVCFAWGMGDDQSLRNVATSRTKAIYTWSEHNPRLSSSLNLEFMPMLWGGDDGRVNSFKNAVRPGFTGRILGFNEPNLNDQAGMTPQRAAQVWIDNIEPYCRAGAQCISPATTSAPTGIDWMRQFLDACNGRCSVDAYALHWYGTNPDEFKRYVTTWITTFNKPVYVTEYACHTFAGGAQCTQDSANNFHREVAQWMDSQDRVVFYCPFGFFKQMPGGVSPVNQLMDGNGNPTPLGNRYIHGTW